MEPSVDAAVTLTMDEATIVSAIGQAGRVRIKRRPDRAHSRAEGVPLRCSVGLPFQIIFIAHDDTDTLLPDGGSSFSADGVATDALGAHNPVAVSVTDLGNGRAGVQVTAPTVGSLTLNVRIRHGHVVGSPFTLAVGPPRDFATCTFQGRCIGSEGSAPGQFNRPCGISIDAEGNMIVADTHNHRVQIFTRDGAFVSTFGSHGTAPGQFASPFGVAVTQAGLIAVADRDNHRVQLLGHDGTVQRIIGTHVSRVRWCPELADKGIANLA